MVDEFGDKLDVVQNEKGSEELYDRAQNMGDGSLQAGGELGEKTPKWGGKEYLPSNSPEQISQTLKMALQPHFWAKAQTSVTQGGWA